MRDGKETEEDKVVEQIIKKALHDLGEHCESVRIFVTYRSGGADGVTGVSMGAGNVYAQRGQIHDWIITQDELSARDVWADEDEDDL